MANAKRAGQGCAVGLVATLAVTACTATTPLERPEREPALRRLIVMLDGVPHAVMDSLWEAGRFRAFRRPARMISPFPSLTGVSFRDIWREPLTHGYEDLYYDRGENRVAGGLFDHVFEAEEHAGFHRYVDVKPGGVAASLAYLVPLTMARQELNALRKRIAERMVWDSVIVAYVVSTDAVTHRAPDDLPAVLLEVDRLITDVIAVTRPDLDVVLFSDHGNDMLPSRRVFIEEALDAAGFRLADSIEEWRDVVLPRFGLVGSAFAYTTPGRRIDVAAALRGLEGVELVAFADSAGRVQVWSANGRAIIEWNPQADTYRYTAVQGDPLELNPVVERLRASGRADATGAAHDSVWLRETANATFVDPLRRLTLGIRAVQNPADVIISLAPGYHFGDGRADLFVDVQGTHGSLRATSSLAFVMATRARTPDPVRSDALHRWIPLPKAEVAASQHASN